MDLFIAKLLHSRESKRPHNTGRWQFILQFSHFIRTIFMRSRKRESKGHKSPACVFSTVHPLLLSIQTRSDYSARLKLEICSDRKNKRINVPVMKKVILQHIIPVLLLSCFSIANCSISTSVFSVPYRKTLMISEKLNMKAVSPPVQWNRRTPVQQHSKQAISSNKTEWQSIIGVINSYFISRYN